MLRHSSHLAPQGTKKQTTVAARSKNRKWYASDPHFRLEEVVGLTGFVIIHVFIASLSPAKGERNQMVNTKFTRPVNEMPMSISG